MLSSLGELGKKIFWLLKLKNQKVGCIRNISQKTVCERSLDNPKKWRICISCGRWLSKIIRKRLRIPRTHCETGIHSEERESRTENLKAIGKSVKMKTQKMTKESIRIFGLTQKLGKNSIHRHHIEPGSSTYVPREESFLIYQISLIERNSSEKKYTMREEDWRSQNIWGKKKTNSIKLMLQERTEFCSLLKLCAWIRSYEKISRKLFTEFSLKVKASTCCLVSRHSESVRQNSSSKPKNQGSTRYSQERTWEEKKYELRMLFCSANFQESRATYGSEDSWRSVSQRRMPRETGKHKQKISHVKQ